MVQPIITIKRDSNDLYSSERETAGQRQDNYGRVDMIHAETLNSHLRSGGAVQVTTGARSTIYTSEHAGWFSTGLDRNLYVQWGGKKNCLTFGKGKHLLVGIRLAPPIPR